MQNAATFCKELREKELGYYLNKATKAITRMQKHGAIQCKCACLKCIGPYLQDINNVLKDAGYEVTENGEIRVKGYNGDETAMLFIARRGWK